MDQAAQDRRTQLWNLMVELRKETVESQKIRAQIIGFKITFLSAGVGLILANSGRIPQTLLVIPAFAAIFFDFLLQSYSFSIKRIGRYCRRYLEPSIFEHDPSKSLLPWHQFLTEPENRQRYSMMGNLGITLLAVIPAIVVLCAPFRWRVSLPLLIALVWFLALDLISFLATDRYAMRV
jgi:hypothetical protein